MNWRISPATAVHLAWCAAIGGGLAATSQYYTIGVSHSQSLPELLFLVERGHPFQRGDAVQFIAPPNPMFTKPFVKRVVGLPGDLVEHRGGDVFVAGRRVGPVQTQTLQGRPLQPGPAGIIPEGYLFLAGSHERSYDSRYAEIGLVPVTAVVGRAVPLL
ncbi:signal peptidase I [Asticcacaulis sp.]|uniref:signal peptidase I n=1 Tax=Asticcacaulis sp. TaxID=1872648 RepID=UPI00260C6BAA|nr:signal peptidase I [Asticcacaulis sp.]